MACARLLALGLFLSACSDSAPPMMMNPEPTELLPPERGFQIRTAGIQLPPGTEKEYCEVVALEGDPSQAYYVNKIEAQMSAGSHHLIITAAIPGSATDAAAEVGKRVECPLGARIFGNDRVDVIGSQTPYYSDVYPAGIGRVFYGGQKLIFDYHYLNATTATITAEARVNLHVVDESEVQRVAMTDGFYNLTIKTQPRERKTFLGECRFSQDVLVHKLVRHTHQWGRDFSAWFAGGERDGEHIFTSTHYEDTDHIFDAPMLIRAGEGLRFACEYLNTESYPLVFGPTAADEMCILFITWWTPEVGQTTADQKCYMSRVHDDGVAR